MVRSRVRESAVRTVLGVVLVAGVVGAAQAGTGKTVTAALAFQNGKFTLTVGGNQGVSSRVVVGPHDTVQLNVCPVNMLLYKVQVNQEAKTVHLGDVSPFLPATDQSAGALAGDNSRELCNPASPDYGFLTANNAFRNSVRLAADAVKACNAIAGGLTTCILDTETTPLSATADAITAKKALKDAATNVVQRQEGQPKEFDLVDRDLSAVGKAMLGDVEKAWTEADAQFTALGEKATADDKSAHSVSQSIHEQFKGERDALQASFDKAGRLYNGVLGASFAGPADTCSRASGNEFTFTVTITPNTDNIPHQFQGGTYKLTVLVRHDIEIDASAGYTFTGLVDHKYRVTGTSPDQKVIRVKGAEDSVRAAPAALLHVYWNSDTWIKGGFSFGLATSDAKRIVYMAGPSLFLSNDRRFVLTGGLAMGPTSVLNRQAPLTSEGLANVTDVMRCSWFVALSYNLGTLVK